MELPQAPHVKDEDGTLEDWVSYFRRSTYEAQKMSNAAGVTDWEVEQRRRKWRSAGHVARMTDRRWTWVLLMWVPTRARRVGRPKGRWENALIDFFAGRPEERSWLTIAKDREVWRSQEREFVNEK